MTLEIQEIVIKAQVKDAQGAMPSPEEGSPLPTDLESLIQECVKQVLQILEDKKAR